VKALAAAMVRIAADPGGRERMGEAAREHIRKHFPLERMTSDYLRILG
jgi:glycosyltransferase involved in cell wall biosynthesis